MKDSMYKQSKLIRRAKFITARWNETVKIGDFVEYEPKKGDKTSRRLYKTKSEAFLSNDKATSCIFLEDFSGYVDTEFLHPIRNKQKLYKLNK